MTKYKFFSQFVDWIWIAVANLNTCILHYLVAKLGTEALGVYLPSWAHKPTSLIVVFWLPNFCTVVWGVKFPPNVIFGGNEDLPWLDILLFGSVVQTLITKTYVACKWMTFLFWTYLAFQAGYLFSHTFRRPLLLSSLSLYFSWKALLWICSLIPHKEDIYI